MAKRTARRHIDRHGATPTADDDHISAVCLVNRHARCKAEVISLTYVGPCSCHCHQLPIPSTWKGAAA